MHWSLGHQGEPSGGSSHPESRSTPRRVGWCWLCHGLWRRGSMGHWWAPEPAWDIPPPRRLWSSSAYTDPMGQSSMSQPLCFSLLVHLRRGWQPAATAGHPDGQQGWVQRCGQPVSPTLVPGEGQSVGSRASPRRWVSVWAWAHRRASGLPESGKFNQKELTGEIWEKRAVSGLPLTPW